MIEPPDPGTTHAEERKLVETHLSALVMDTEEDEKLRLELLDLYRRFADATDAAVKTLLAQRTLDEKRVEPQGDPD